MITINYPAQSKFEQTDYRIFLSDDTGTCYLYKQTGHTSNRCRMATENITTDSQQLHQNTITNDTENTNQQLDTELLSNITNNCQALTQEQMEQVKRPASSSTSSYLQTNNEPTTENLINLSQTKSIAQDIPTNKSSLATKLKESQSKERKASNPPITPPTTQTTNDTNFKANKPN